MRLRLWWHLCVLDSRAPEDQGLQSTVDLMNRELRLPLNVNENQICPDMTRIPLESDSWTEMSFFFFFFGFKPNRADCYIRFLTLKGNILQMLFLVSQQSERLCRSMVNSCLPNIVLRLGLEHPLICRALQCNISPVPPKKWNSCCNYESRSAWQSKKGHKRMQLLACSSHLLSWPVRDWKVIMCCWRRVLLPDLDGSSTFIRHGTPSPMFCAVSVVAPVDSGQNAPEFWLRSFSLLECVSMVIRRGSMMNMDTVAFGDVSICSDIKLYCWGNMPSYQWQPPMSKPSRPAVVNIALPSFFQIPKSCRPPTRQQQRIEHPSLLNRVNSSLLISIKVSFHLWICQCQRFHFWQIGMRSSMAAWKMMVTQVCCDEINPIHLASPIILLMVHNFWVVSRVCIWVHCTQIWEIQVDRW